MDKSTSRRKNTPRWIAVLILLMMMLWVDVARGEVLVQTRRWNGAVRSVQGQPGEDDSLLLDTGDRVFLMGTGADGWALQHVWPLPRPSTGGVTMADVTGDGHRELIIGSDGAGATYVYTRRAGEWSPLGRTDYLWTPVHAVQAGRVSHRGRHDIVVTAEDGRVHLFGWSFGEFTLRWSSPPADGNPWHVRVTDLTGDGLDEVILWRPGGYVGVWSWTGGTLSPVWENYPWGLISALTIGDVDGDGLPDIVLNTSQGLLYAFGWKDGEFQTKRHLSHVQLPFPRLAVQGKDRGASRRGVDLLASDGTRLFMYRLDAQGVVRRWASGPAGTIEGMAAAPDGHGFFVWDEEGGLRLLEPAPGASLRLEWNRQERTLRFRPVVEDGVLWLSARDMADLLSWQIDWDPVLQRLTMTGWPSYMVGRVGLATVMTEQGPQQLQAPLRIVDDRVYIPYDVLSAIGFEVTWDELTRSLTVNFW